MATSTCRIRRSTRRCARSGGSGEGSVERGSPAGLSAPARAGRRRPAGVADGVDQRAAVRSAAARHADRGPARASGVRLDVCGPGLPTFAGQRYENDLCGEHTRQWTERPDGVSRAQFLITATPFDPRPQSRHRPDCRLCPQRPSTGTDTRLCRRHQRRWERARREQPGLRWDEWLASEVAFPGLGECAVSSCTILSCTPRQLFWWHETAYRQAGRPAASGCRTPGGATTTAGTGRHR